MNQSSYKVILVAENISRKMGGEAAKNLIYYEKIKANGLEIKVVCHGRVKAELQDSLSAKNISNFYFIQDSILQIIIWKIGQFFPLRLQELIFTQLISISTKIRMIQLVKQIIEKENIDQRSAAGSVVSRRSTADLIFEPTPNTPKAPSTMYNLGIPVVVGPLKGGMELPPAFQDMDSSFTLATLNTGKFSSSILQKLMPGKLLADIILVGDQATQALLPRGYQGKVYEILECGVDLNKFQNIPQKSLLSPQDERIIKFVFTGRLVDWKGVQFLLEAFAQVLDRIDASLEIIGDGKLKTQLQKQAEDLGISEKVHFRGWLTETEIIESLSQSDIFVMPSLRESCGNSILEAMAAGLPVIATNWGGPSRLLNQSCGRLVNPDSKADFIQNFALEMIDLAQLPDTRIKMGEAGQRCLRENYFDWDSKVERILEI